MKKTTKKIVESFPMLESKLHAYENSFLREEALESLSEVERAFLKLAWFFEQPKHESFDLRILYQHLDDQRLELALGLIVGFFREDTFLITQPSFLLIREGDEYLNQIQFADYLREQGLKYDRSKLNVYYKRGKIPKADVELSGTPYWSKKTVERYCEQEKKRVNSVGY